MHINWLLFKCEFWLKISMIIPIFIIIFLVCLRICIILSPWDIRSSVHNILMQHNTFALDIVFDDTICSDGWPEGEGNCM